MDKREYLTDSFRSVGLELNETQIGQFLTYEELLTEWNQRMNLTAITEYKDIVWKHFIDSTVIGVLADVSRETGRDGSTVVGDDSGKDADGRQTADVSRETWNDGNAVVGSGSAKEPVGWERINVSRETLDALKDMKKLLESEQTRIVDIGTGAGFPGIPLKILYPKCEVLLLDSSGKKVSFLREVIKNCRLTGITANQGRAEELGHMGACRESFDLCVSRAVADYPVLSEYCLPLLRIGGLFVSYKSGTAAEEAERGRGAVELLGGRIGGIVNYSLAAVESENEITGNPERTDIGSENGSDTSKICGAERKPDRAVTPTSKRVSASRSGQVTGPVLERAAVLTLKVRPTPERYPRRPGIPAKRPLRGK